MLALSDLLTLNRKPIISRDESATPTMHGPAAVSRRDLELVRLRRLLADMIVRNEARRRSGACLA